MKTRIFGRFVRCRARRMAKRLASVAVSAACLYFLLTPEIALLGLLEVILGPLWAWLGAGETPATPTLIGGAVPDTGWVFVALADITKVEVRATWTAVKPRR